ncbi:hypothetical protein HW509_10460 [Asaia spathodeae]|uniref:hypothetical protein n=1 Tax=Asaia spathodeae TaxID=657016 RepID=UPI002FC36ACB
MSHLPSLVAKSLPKFYEENSNSFEDLQKDKYEINRLFRGVKRLDFLRWAIGFPSLVISVTSAGTLINLSTEHPYQKIVLFNIFAILFSLFCVCCASLRLVQSGNQWFSRFIPDLNLSDDATRIIEELSKGSLRAHFVTASPLSKKAVFRAPDGEKLESEMSSRVFKSLFCPLLLIDNPDYWHFVLADYRNIFSGIRRPIYVQTSPSLRLDETATFSDERAVEAEEDRLKSHWRHSIPPEFRTQFCKTFIRIGKWRDDDAIKVRSALNAVLEYDQSVPLRGGQEQRAFLARVAINALTTAQIREGFPTLWLSKGAEGNGDPTQSLSKFFGYAKDHDYVRYRIETFKEMGLKDQSSISN